MVPDGKVAVAFASALVAGEFDRARSLLTPELQLRYSAVELREQFLGMFEGYAGGQPERIHFEEEFAHDEWPGKAAGEIGCAYVGIEGEDFFEAVTVIVSDVAGKHLIREIQWGRP